MKYKFKYIIMKLQEVLSSIVRSKAFIFAIIAIIFGFILVMFDENVNEYNEEHPFKSWDAVSNKGKDKFINE